MASLHYWHGKFLLRHGQAFAKKGREVYAYTESMIDIFSAKISSDFQDAVSPIGKAARAYLDICFFHPFTDGNSRLARLVFDYYLTLGGVIMKDVTPLFLFSKNCGLRKDYIAFLETVIWLAH